MAEKETDEDRDQRCWKCGAVGGLISGAKLVDVRLVSDLSATLCRRCLGAWQTLCFGLSEFRALERVRDLLDGAKMTNARDLEQLSGAVVDARLAMLTASRKWLDWYAGVDQSKSEETGKDERDE